MKNREQANNRNNLNDPNVVHDPQAQVEIDDLPISGKKEDSVKGGTILQVNGGGNTPNGRQ